MIRLSAAFLAVVMFSSAVQAQTSNGTVFTYQGQLKQNGAPVNGSRAMTVRLFDASSAGGQLASDLDLSAVPVAEGLFTVELDFGAEPFATNEARWLEVEVEGAVLSPRQSLTSTPFSLATRGIAVSASGAVGIGTDGPPTSEALAVEGGTVSIKGNGNAVLQFKAANPGGHQYEWYNDIHNGSPSGYFALYDRTAGSVPFAVAPDGHVGIGVTAPGAQLHVRRTQPDNENLLELSFEGGDVGSTSEDAALLRVTSNSGFRPFFSLKNGSFLVDVSGDLISKRNAYIGNGSGGFVSIGQSGGDYGNIGYGFGFTNVSGQHTYRFNDFASKIDFRSGGFRFITAPSGTQGANVPWTERMTVTQGGNVGIGTVSPQAKLDVAGVSRCDVLEIDGGADISEPFHIGPTQGEHQPGHVVCIDPMNPEWLTLSSTPYDRKVAGVLSGAGGVKPGLTLHQEGTSADGTDLVALTGRVYVWCDGDAGGSIGPGDLLTTSPTPGHAMKVTDYDRANGAVLGKAMARLTAGRGLVLVLVGLQ